MELKDYSGEFKPDLRMEDFSKDALIKLIKIAGKDLVEMSGLWYALVLNKYGRQVANDFSKQVWARKDSLMPLHDMDRVLPAFNIKGDDIATVFKYTQLSPTIGVYNWDHEIEMKDKNYAILTVTRCLTLEYSERHGDWEGLKHACVDIDTPWIQNVASHFNPKIRVRPLTELPRRRKDKKEVPCQWEFRLVE